MPSHGPSAGTHRSKLAWAGHPCSLVRGARGCPFAKRVEARCIPPQNRLASGVTNRGEQSLERVGPVIVRVVARIYQELRRIQHRCDLRHLDLGNLGWDMCRRGRRAKVLSYVVRRPHLQPGDLTPERLPVLVELPHERWDPTEATLQERENKI